MKVTIRELNSALIACQRSNVFTPPWVANDLKKRIAEALAMQVYVFEISRDSRIWSYMQHIKELAFLNERKRGSILNRK